MAMTKTRQQLASERRWCARLSWIGFHVYGYTALAYAGSFGPTPQGMSEFVTCIVVALLNAAVYVRLQTSSPGFLTPSSFDRSHDLEGGDTQKFVDSEATPAADAVGESDAELLVPRRPHDGVEVVDMGNSKSATRFCDECKVMQPMRTKHCKDCERCVFQYDHHCDCAGTCVGRDNRGWFILYLFTQMLEGFQMFGAATAAFTLQSTIDEWLVANIVYIVVWFSVLVTLLITVSLLCYQLFLISSNQTSWEHARRSAITYLQHLPDEKSPFDRGVIRNWWVFIRGGNSDLWVHPTAKPHQSPLQHVDDPLDDSIM